MKLIKASVLLLGFSISAIAYAIAPVVDAYNEGDSTAATNNTTTNNKASSDNTRSFSLEQRLSIQEHQIANLNPLLVQTDDLTQKLQALQGRVEEQEHRLKRLEETVRNQYLDLEKRLTQRSTTNPTEPELKQSSPSLPNPSLMSNKQTIAVRRPPPPASRLPNAAGERAYQAAFQLLKNKEYVPAIEGFEDFIKKYPSDINRANAHYFLGQLYLLQGQPEPSISRFNYFVTHYPQDARVPDALLQLGLAYFAKGEKITAMDTFKKIIQHYPDSRAAQSAQARLQQFQAMMSAANLPTKNKA